MEARNRAVATLKRAIAVVLASKAEVIMMFFALAFYMPYAFIQNLIIQKLCLGKNYSRDYCLNNAINETLEDSLQGETTQLLLYYYLLKQVPAIILSLFMGQWCDKYGRKWVMIVSFAGSAVSAILNFVNAWFIDWPPIFVVLSALPAGLGGDFTGFMIGFMGYVRDVFPLKSVSVRLSTADGMSSLANQVGPLIGGQLYLRFGAEGVFLACAAMLIVGLVLTAIFVKDEKFKKGADNCVVVRDFFDCRGFVSSLVVVFKKRDGHFRAYILCIMISMFITTLTYSGFMELLYLYTRLTVQWDVTTLNFYNGLIGGTNAIGSFLLLPLLVHVFHWSDTSLGLLGLVAYVVYYYILAFAKKSAVIFGIVSLQVLTMLPYVTFRSVVTKCVSDTEIGKMGAAYAVVQAVATNLGDIVATQIYARTFRLFPGTYFLFIGSISLICVALYTWISVDLRRNHIVLEEAYREPEENNVS